MEKLAAWIGLYLAEQKSSSCLEFSLSLFTIAFSLSIFGDAIFLFFYFDQKLTFVYNFEVARHTRLHTLRRRKTLLRLIQTRRSSLHFRSR